MRKRFLRAAAALALASTTLWAVAAAATAEDIRAAADALALTGIDWEQCALDLLRFERGELFTGSLSLPTELALRATPLLLTADGNARREETPETAGPAPLHGAPRGTEEPGGTPQTPQAPEAPKAEPEAPEPAQDNGMPATTLRPSDPAGYLVRGRVYVHNTSSAPLEAGDLAPGFPAALGDDAPQVLIVHTHGCEAYTMPPGEEYEASDDHRTLDEAYNVVRVGDELARELEAAGIGVVHDRTLHDYPSYSGSYNRSLATVEDYLARYPSISFVLDVHRDAITDADGREYRLLCEEAPGAAQLEFVVGSDGGGLSHERWRDNLRLACAVQETLLERFPTLMRPIVVRNSRYNQQVCPGSLLLEVGTAGNSLEEALAAARLFARGFAETIKTNRDQPNG